MRKKLGILLFAEFLVCIANPVAQYDDYEGGETLENINLYPNCDLPIRSQSFETGETIQPIIKIRHMNSPRKELLGFCTFLCTYVQKKLILCSVRGGSCISALLKFNLSLKSNIF